MNDGVVIVGGGQAGFQTAASLRSEGYDGSITLIGDEPGVPYQRPPLSKGFLTGKQIEEQIALRPAAFYSSHRIELVSGQRITSIDTAQRRLSLGDSTLDYDKLVLAVGARNRLLPVPGAEREHVRYLRTLAESMEVKQRLEQAQSVVVIGGGFIGLEIAAAARARGKSVTLIEAVPRLMARATAPVVSQYFQETHGAQDVDVILNASVTEIRDHEVVLNDGSIRAADLVIVGVGVVPNVELAQAAGLPVANGICANEFLQTGDPHVYAIGDCVAYPNRYAGKPARLESVQNAVDQAICVAKAIVGKVAPYDAVPWFWTEQFDIRMQMAGLHSGYDQVAIRGNLDARKFSAFYFREGRFIAADSINRPADHLAARKLLAAGTVVTPAEAADETFDLKRISNK